MELQENEISTIQKQLKVDNATAEKIVDLLHSFGYSQAQVVNGSIRLALLVDLLNIVQDYPGLYQKPSPYTQGKPL